MTVSEMIKKAQDVANIASDCRRRKVGSVIVMPNKQFVIGYNHSTTNCKENGCPREAQGVAPGKELNLCHAIHAEVDAIERSNRLDIDIRGAHIHVTDQPCDACAEAIINAGIKSVTYVRPYPHSNSLELFGKAGVVAIKVGEEDA